MRGSYPKNFNVIKRKITLCLGCMVKVSVVIPVYNAESTLEKCIGSILTQSYKNFELILVDDGSEDCSLEICNNYAQIDNRVKVFSQQNSGVSSARNLGIEHASGEWITFIDSDDFVEPCYFEGIDDLDQDILFCNYVKNANGKCLQKLDVSDAFAKFSFNKVLYNYYGNPIIRAPWAKFFKRSLVSDLRYPKNMKVGEDTYFVFLYLSKCQTFGVMPRSYYMFEVSVNPDEVKYAMSVEYAADCLLHLRFAFVQIAAKYDLPKRLFLAYIGYFKRVSKESWKSLPSKWYDNPMIKEMYNYVWSNLNFSTKLRINLAKLLNR